MKMKIGLYKFTVVEINKRLSTSIYQLCASILSDSGVESACRYVKSKIRMYSDIGLQELTEISLVCKIDAEI